MFLLLLPVTSLNSIDMYKYALCKFDVCCAMILQLCVYLPLN